MACEVLGDGAGIRISRHVLYCPDALAYEGPKLAASAVEIPNPAIVVEVASPSTRKFDETAKRDGYFSRPSVQHYLTVDPAGPPVVHHSRRADGATLRSEAGEGSLALSVAEMLALEL